MPSGGICTPADRPIRRDQPQPLRGKPQRGGQLSAAEETMPVTLMRGPLDGLRLDLTPSTREVGRRTMADRFAIYRRLSECLFLFDRYESIPPGFTPVGTQK